MALLDSTVDVYEKTTRYSLGRCGNVLVVIWHDTATLQDFVSLEARTMEFVARHPKGILVLIVIEDSNTKPPPAPVREANAKLVKTFEQSILGMARVLEGSGVKFTAIRLVLSTIELMSSPHVPAKTVGSVEEAVEFLRTISRDLSVGAVTAAVRRIRARQVKPEPVR